MGSFESKIPRSVFIDTLRHPNYAKLLTGQVIAAFGDRINHTALLSIVVYVYGSAAKYGADITFWAVLPAVLLGPFAIGLIDRWNRQRTMIVSDVARALLAISLPLLMYYIPHHYVIYSMVFFIGIFSALFAPTRLAIMPNLVPPQHLMSANAISSQAGTMASIAAMPISGWLVEHLRNASFFVNGATYLISAFFIWQLRPSEQRPPEVNQHPIADFKQGFQYIKENKLVLFYVAFYGLIQCVVAIFFVSFLSYGVDILGQTVGGTNLLFLSVALGMVPGALFTGLFPKYSERFDWPMWMMAFASLGISFLSYIYTPWPASFLLFGIGFCAAMVLIPLDTYLQKHVPDHLRGRVFVVRGVLYGIGFLASLQFSKAPIYRFGVLAVLEWLGILSCLFALISLSLGRYLIKKNREEFNHSV